MAKISTQPASHNRSIMSVLRVCEGVHHQLGVIDLSA